MVKRIIGFGIIAVLIIIAGINIYQQQTSSSDSGNINDVTGDTSQEGAYIVSDHEGLEEGDQPPNFELETLDGEKVKLSDLKGKKVILNFWATWCPPCREEMPEMQEFYEEYGDEVEIIALNATATESSEEDVHNYIEEYGYTYPVLLDKDGSVVDEYKVFSMPTSYFIGTDGMIQQPSHIGPMDYEFMVEVLDDLS